MPEDLNIRIDLNAPVTLSVCVHVMRAFFRWWQQELIDILPSSWQERWLHTARRPRVIIGEDRWRLEDGDDLALEFANNTPPYVVQEELTRRAPVVLTHSAEVVLPANEGLFKRIRIPSDAVAQVRQVVQLQLDRLSPFRGDDVQFDCRVLEETTISSDSVQSGNGDALVEVVIVPKRRLMAIEQMLRETGIVPSAFCLDGVTARFATQGLPWTKQAQHRTAAIFLTFVLVIAAIAFGPSSGEADIADLKANTETLAPLVEHALADRKSLERYQLPPQALSADRAAVTDVVIDLTQLLPDNVYLTELKVRGDLVSMQGVATAAVPVGTLLRRSIWLTNVEVTRQDSNDHFTATAALRRSPSRRGE